MKSKKGFTLVEMLVVVLIIGILAAIAVPQYQYAVLKSKYHTLMDITQAIKNAQEIYFLANGKYAEHFSELDISMPGGTHIENVEILNTNKKPTGIMSEALVFDDTDNHIVLFSSQVMANMRKNNDYYMDYNLKYDNINMWNGARALCVAWAEAGSLGQRVCNNLTKPENCSSNSIGRYACSMF